MSGRPRRRRHVRLAYYLRIPNAGDLANPLVVSPVANRGVVRVVPDENPHLIAIGSVMQLTTPASLIWGTGVISPEVGVGGVSTGSIYALRGKLSHEVLRENGIDVSDVPLGDPGYLLPEILDIQRSAEPQYSLGLIPHYVDRYSPAFQKLRATPGVCDLDVHEEPRLFLEKLAQCETVASSSLHGLVFAEALGIPSLWVQESDEVFGDGFKFRDWFSTTGNPQHSPHMLGPSDTADQLFRQTELRESTISSEDLRQAFPRSRLRELTVGMRPRVFWPEYERPLPVFLLSRNAGGLLEDAIRSIGRLAKPVEIVIHDSGSDDAKTLKMLGILQARGIRVYRGSSWEDNPAVGLNNTIESYFSTWTRPSRYVVSNCNVDMTTADKHCLDVFDEMLNMFPQAHSVGPMRSVEDGLTDSKDVNHPTKKECADCWGQEPSFVQTDRGEVAYQETVGDTTFALHRAGESVGAAKLALRLYYPYDARHLERTVTDASQ